MNKNELLQCLLDFDRDAWLKFGSNNGLKYECYIVGGGALLILDLIDLTIEGMISDYDRRELKDFYNDYKEKYTNEAADL